MRTYTDDEIEKHAEEYFCEHCENCSEHDNGQCSNCSKWDYFIAGAKWGYEKGYEDCRHYAHDYYKPKWHNLRENPNDLPKLENKDFSWSITVANQLGEACHYNYDKSRWETPYFTEIEGVISWCELPKFWGSKRK